MSTPKSRGIAAAGCAWLVLSCAGADVQVVDKMSSLEARSLEKKTRPVHVTVSGAGWTYGYDLREVLAEVARRGYEPIACASPDGDELKIALSFEDATVHDTIREQVGVVTNELGMVVGGKWKERLVERENSGFGIVRVTLERAGKKLFQADARFEHPDYNKLSITEGVAAVLARLPEGSRACCPPTRTRSPRPSSR